MVKTTPKARGSGSRQLQSAPGAPGIIPHLGATSLNQRCFCASWTGPKQREADAISGTRGKQEMLLWLGKIVKADGEGGRGWGGSSKMPDQ